MRKYLWVLLLGYLVLGTLNINAQQLNQEYTDFAYTLRKTIPQKMVSGELGQADLQKLYHYYDLSVANRNAKSEKLFNFSYYLDRDFGDADNPQLPHEVRQSLVSAHDAYLRGNKAEFQKLITQATSQVAAWKNPSTENTTAPVVNNVPQTAATTRSSAPHAVTTAPVTEAPADTPNMVTRASGAIKFRGATEPQVFWEEGKGNLRGNYGNERFWTKDMASWTSMTDIPPTTGLVAASKNRELSQELAKTLDKWLPHCVAEAAGLAKIPQPISIVHNGIKGDHAHAKPSAAGNYSLHNLSRAIDISDIKFTDANGKAHYYLYTIASHAYMLDNRGLENKKTPLMIAQANFFLKLKNCWEAHGGAIVDWNDPHHQGHMHFSLPRRKGEGFYAK